MRLSVKRFQNADTLFFLAYGLFLVAAVLERSFYVTLIGGTPDKLIRYLWFALLAARELLQLNYDKRTLLSAAVLGFFILLTRVFTSNFFVGIILMFLFCARNVDFDRIARFTVLVTSVMLLFVVASSLLGIIQNYLSINAAGRTRYYLGFRYSLYGPAFLLNITALSLYAWRESLRWRLLALLLVVNCAFFAATNSRMSFVLALALLALFAVYKLRPALVERPHRLLRLLVLSFLGCFVLSVGFTALYNSELEWMYSLNLFLGKRLSLGHSSLLESGIPLLGQQLEMIGNGLNALGEKSTKSYNYVDCFYVLILQRYGVLFTAALLGAVTLALQRFWEKGDHLMLLCLSMIALHCVIDDLSLYLYYNAFWLALAILLPGQAEDDWVHRQLLLRRTQLLRLLRRDKAKRTDEE